MNMYKKSNIVHSVICIGAAIWLLSSCDGILGSRYDAPEEDVEFGFIKFDSETSSGTIYIDASSYTRWTYLDLDTRTMDTTKEDIFTTDKITIDMTGMMDGNIIYAPSSYNEELSGWLNVDTSQMPPIYTMSGKVYLLRVSDGRHAAIILRDYMNDAKVKGFMTIDYVFPVDLK